MQLLPHFDNVFIKISLYSRFMFRYEDNIFTFHTKYGYRVIIFSDLSLKDLHNITDKQNTIIDTKDRRFT